MILSSLLIIKEIYLSTEDVTSFIMCKVSSKKVGLIFFCLKQDFIVSYVCITFSFLLPHIIYHEPFIAFKEDEYVPFFFQDIFFVGGSYINMSRLPIWDSIIFFFYKMFFLIRLYFSNMFEHQLLWDCMVYGWRRKMWVHLYLGLEEKLV